MILKFIVLLLITLSLCSISKCATSWSSLGFVKPKIYIQDDTALKSIDGQVNTSEQENKDKPNNKKSSFGSKYAFWKKKTQISSKDSGSDTASDISENSPKIDEQENNDKPIRKKSSFVPSYMFWEKKSQVRPTDSSSETASDTDEDSFKKSEKIKKEDHVAAERNKSIKMIEDSKNINEDYVADKKDELIRTSEYSKSLNVEKGKTPAAPISARIAEARAIKNALLEQKEQRDTLWEATKETVKIQKKAALEISNKILVNSAKKCFVSKNSDECRYKFQCEWNDSTQSCDVKCSLSTKQNSSEPLNSCNSILGIRKNENIIIENGDNTTNNPINRIGDSKYKSMYENKNEFIIRSKQYRIEKICKFETINAQKKRGHCVPWENPSNEPRPSFVDY
ncbi:MAG: hypothetical protein Q8S21_03775 [Candidatus Paracaedibacteraceae bacterium]|nr:hypothetical protein [Candidatus Paracaedibacteraceae bacterium]